MEQESTTQQPQENLDNGSVELSLDQKARQEPVSAPLPNGASAVFYLIFAAVQVLAAIPLFYAYQNSSSVVLGYCFLAASLLLAVVAIPFVALAIRDGWSCSAVGKCCVALSILLCCWLTLGKF